jgi:hypothetical protein
VQGNHPLLRPQLCSMRGARCVGPRVAAVGVEQGSLRARELVTAVGTNWTDCSPALFSFGRMGVFVFLSACCLRVRALGRFFCRGGGGHMCTHMHLHVRLCDHVRAGFGVFSTHHTHTPGGMGGVMEWFITTGRPGQA